MKFNETERTAVETTCGRTNSRYSSTRQGEHNCSTIKTQIVEPNPQILSDYSLNTNICGPPTVTDCPGFR